MCVVRFEYLDLPSVERCAHGKRQVFNVVRAHVELKNLEARGACSVVEVVNLEQVNLLNETVRRIDVVHPSPIIVLRVDDRHRLLVQRVGITVPHADQRMYDRVIKAKDIETHQSGVCIFEPLKERNDFFGVVAAVTDFK